MISTQTWEDARLLWNYHRMHHDLRPCSVAVGLGSHDLGVADVTAELYHQGMAPVIVFTGATSPRPGRACHAVKLSSTASECWSSACPIRP